MSLRFKPFAVLSAATLAVLALLWVIVRDSASEPYTIDGGALSGWTLVAGDGTDPYVVAIQPPEDLSGTLLRQLSVRVGSPLIPPRHAAMPLVLRGEYADALQGVYGAVDIVRMLGDQAMETARFEPICIGHRIDTTGAQPIEFFFVAFASDAFWRARHSLVPEFPEHAGIGTFNPAGLTPILPIAATSNDFDRWWPIQLDHNVDCQAQIFVRSR